MALNDAIVVVTPVDFAVAQTGGWVSLKGASSVTFVLTKGAGTAGQPPVLTFRQATSLAGANAKDLATITTIYKKASGSSTWTKVTQAAAATYTGDVAAGIYKIEVSASQLDLANGFCAVTVNVASSGAAAQLGGIVAELNGQRYSGALDSALAPFSAEAVAEEDTTTESGSTSPATAATPPEEENAPAERASTSRRR